MVLLLMILLLVFSQLELRSRLLAALMLLSWWIEEVNMLLVGEIGDGMLDSAILSLSCFHRIQGFRRNLWRAKNLTSSNMTSRSLSLSKFLFLHTL
jgi:hypothetical protein